MINLIRDTVHFEKLRLASFHKLYRWEVLFLFVLLEVLTFGDASAFQSIIALLEYVFIAFVFFQNKKLGIMYHLSFTILTFGIGNYDALSLEPANFWGIRLFGFSLNILFSLVLFTIVVVTNKTKGYIIKCFKEFKPYLLFFLFSLCTGLFYLSFSVNHSDNFLLDLLTYFPIVIYSYLIFRLSPSSIFQIVRYCFALTVLSFILSFIFGKYFQYGTDKFFPTNAIYFILPFVLILVKGIYSPFFRFLLLIIVVWAFVFGYYFISGKTIMTVAMLLLILMFSNLYTGILGILILVLVVPNLSNILIFFIEYYPEGTIRGKFIQIQQAVDNFNIHAVAMIPSSMGNIIAELLTISKYYFQQVHFFVLGKGLGGGVSDVYGYLSPWTQINGYAEHDAVRNDFFKMHLAIFEVFVKTGIVGFAYYLFFLTKGFFSKNKLFLIHSVLLFGVFYVSKETLLLTLLIYRLRDFKYENSCS